MDVRQKIEGLAGRFSPHRFVLVAITFSLSLVFALATFGLLRGYERDRMQVDLDRRTGNAMAFVQSDLIQKVARNIYLNPLLSLRELAGGKAPLTRELFESHVQPAQTGPGLDISIMWIPVVRRDLVTTFEHDQAIESGGPFKVRGVEKSSVIGPVGNPAYALPVTYTSATENAQEILGIDFAIDPEVRSALENSRDTGLPASLGRVPLILQGESLVDWIYFLPVYSGSQVPDSIEERRAKILGYAASRGLVSGKAINALFPREFAGIDVVMFQQELNGPENPGTGATNSQSEDPIRKRYLQELAQLSRGAKIDLHGAPWGMIARPRPELVAMHRTLHPYIGFVLMILYGFLFSVFLWRTLAQKVRVEENVKSRTAELEKANKELANEIDEREKAVEELHRSERYFKGLIDNTLDIITVLSIDGTILFQSPSIERILGYQPADMQGHKAFDYIHPEDIPNVVQNLQAGFDDPTTFQSTQFRMRHQNGEWRHLEGVGRPLLEEGKITAGVINSRDVSDRVEAEREKRTLEDQLRQSMKLESIGTLAGGIAHDFNNLLTGILGYSSLLKLNSVEGEPVHKASVVIEKAAIRGKDLTGQLLGFARKGKLQNVAVGLDSTIVEVVDLLRRTVDKNIDIRTSLNAEGASVLGDPAQIQQVFLNLAVNGRDAMPQGGSLVFETDIVNVDEAYCRVHGDITPGSYVYLCVNDTGDGIPKDVQERIFDPFYTTKEQGQGTGMGLAMAYGSVKNHGGAIRVYSELGRGTTFKIYLPLHTSSAQNALPLRLEQLKRGSGNILLVDDEEIVRELATDILTELGYSVVAVNDGHEALEYYKLHSDEIDLAIIDMIMPRVGGRDCFLRMKEFDPGIKAVLSTGYSKDGAAQEILDEGMLGFAQKPYLATQLSEVVAKAIA